jgi:hypothetical protein
VDGRFFITAHTDRGEQVTLKLRHEPTGFTADIDETLTTGTMRMGSLRQPVQLHAANLTQNIARSADRKWGERYLAVNIPAARYRLVEGGRTVAEGPVTLGAAATPTPLIDGSIDRIELRPSYRIPQSMADRQLWPRQEEDALYFVNHGIRVTDDGLRQVPGAGNGWRPRPRPLSVRPSSRPTPRRSSSSASARPAPQSTAPPTSPARSSPTSTSQSAGPSPSPAVFSTRSPNS